MSVPLKSLRAKELHPRHPQGYSSTEPDTVPFRVSERQFIIRNPGRFLLRAFIHGDRGRFSVSILLIFCSKLDEEAKGMINKELGGIMPPIGKAKEQKVLKVSPKSTMAAPSRNM